MHHFGNRVFLTLALPLGALLTAGAQAPDTTRADTVVLADSAAAALSTATPAKRVFAGPALQLRADLGARELYIIRNGEIVATYPVAIGKDEHPTPRGSYAVRKIVWNPAWVPPDEKWARNKTAKAPGHPGNPMKLVKIFFREPDYYIHGTGELSSLGKAASHGCLRMAPSDAAEVARWVMENGGQPREESWFRRVFRFKRETKTVYLKNPIRMTVEG